MNFSRRERARNISYFSITFFSEIEKEKYFSIVEQFEKDRNCSRALGLSFLGRPIVVARALLLASVRAGGHAQALSATLVAEEQARLPVGHRRASIVARGGAFCSIPPNASI